MRMCVETSFHSITDERWCVSFSLSLSLFLCLFVKNLCSVLFLGSKTFGLCSCRRRVVSKKRRYSRFPFLDFETLYDLLKKRERERERRVYNCILYLSLIHI